MDININLKSKLRTIRVGNQPRTLCKYNSVNI